MKIPTILITAVGKQDPLNKDGKPGPILTAVEVLKPQQVFLVYTPAPAANHTETGSKLVREMLADRGIQTELLPVDLSDPSDYEAVLAAFRRICEDLRSRVTGELAVAVSSGTPAMQAAWLLLVSQGALPAQPYYTPDPRYVTSEQPSVRPMSVGFLMEDALLKTARHLFRSFQFHGAAQALRALSKATPHPDRRSRTDYLARYCEALGLWDDYRLTMACGKLREVSRWIRVAEGLQPTLERLIEDQKRSCEQESPNLLTDLFYNADRSYRRGQYADSLARAVRVYEGALKYWLCQRHAIPASLDELSADRQREIRAWLSQAGITVDERGYLMKYAIERLLLDYFNDQKTREWAEKMRSACGKRNVSIVAHGTQEVRKEEAQNALSILREILSVCGCNLDEYTLASDRIRDQEKTLFGSL